MEHPKDIKVIDWKTDTFGDYPFIKSTFRSDRVWTAIKDVDETNEGKEVLVRGRVHNIRAKGNSAFLVLRESFATLQAVAFKSETTPKEMIKYLGNVAVESIVDVLGKVVKPQNPIESCSQQVELQILKLFVVNRAINRLPLQIVDASRKVTTNEFEL
jgi:aspartyl-tRNA synthetase